MTTRMVYSGMCCNPDCSALVYVAPHPETPDDVVEQIADGPNEWEAFTHCYVCESDICWNGNDLLPHVIRA